MLPTFSTIKKLIIAILIVFVSIGCSTKRLTYTNFLKVEDGMTEKEVIQILGEPTDVTSVGVGKVLGIETFSGTNMMWLTKEAKVNVVFFRGKVQSSNYTNQF